MFGSERVTRLAKLITDVHEALSKIENLQNGEKMLADRLERLSREIAEVRAELRASRAEIRLEALKEAQFVVNSVQGGFHEQMTALALRLDRLERGMLGQAQSIGETSHLDGGDQGQN